MTAASGAGRRGSGPSAWGCSLATAPPPTASLTLCWASPLTRQPAAQALLPLRPAARSRVMDGGKRLAGGPSRRSRIMSKRLKVDDRRASVRCCGSSTLGGFSLAFYCVYKGYTVRCCCPGSWGHGGPALGRSRCDLARPISSLCKSDRSEGGITFEAAKAVNFNVPPKSREVSVDGSGRLKRNAPISTSRSGWGRFFRHRLAKRVESW